LSAAESLEFLRAQADPSSINAERATWAADALLGPHSPFEEKLVLLALQGSVDATFHLLQSRFPQLRALVRIDGANAVFANVYAEVGSQSSRATAATPGRALVLAFCNAITTFSESEVRSSSRCEDAL